MSENLSTRIRELIKRDQLTDACEVLITSRLSKKGIFHFGRLKNLNELVQTGQISPEEATQELNRIRYALLNAADELEGKSISLKRPLYLGLGILGVAGLLALLLFVFWPKPSTTQDCSQATTYTLVVADFMRPEPIFSRTLYTHLAQQFQSHDSVHIGTLARFIDPGTLAKEDTFATVEQETCMDKGMIVYGNLNSLGNEDLFNCFIRLVKLNDPLAEVKTVNGEVVISAASLKAPDIISFSIADKAKIVSDFVAALLKYYWGDYVAAFELFQQTLDQAEDDVRPDFENIGRLCLGNTLVRIGKPSKAIEVYEQIDRSHPLRAEASWNKALAYWHLGLLKELATGLEEYVQLRKGSISAADTFSIRQLMVEVMQGIPEEESSFLVESMGAFLPSDIPALVEESLDAVETNRTTSVSASSEEPSFAELIPKSIDQETNPIEREPDSIPQQASSLPSSADIDTVGKKRASTTRSASPPPVNNKRVADLPEEMILVEGGVFFMGDLFGDGKPAEYPYHKLKIDNFLLGKYEVTFGQYQKYCDDMGIPSPADDGWGANRKPVIRVSWYDAVRYCNWLSLQKGYEPVYQISGTTVSANWKASGYRLPTEAEWEYAARGGGKKVRFGNGKDIATGEDLNFDCTEMVATAYSRPGTFRRGTVAVDALTGSQGKLGFFHMSGNVWEWCWDWYDESYYQHSAKKNPKGPKRGTAKSIRGGSWFDEPPNIRATTRLAANPRQATGIIGFRLARNP